MRIADKMNYNQVQKNISKNRTDMNDLQNQAATQKKINKPSDDPLATTRVLAGKTEERTGNQFVKNINQAKSFLEFSDQSLNELSELLVRAKELAVSQSSDASSNAQTRNVTAQEVQQIFNQAVQIGNRKLGERYIFSGFKTQTMPFNKDGEYFGDSGDLKVQTQKDQFVAMNLPGSSIFLGEGISRDGLVRPGQVTPTKIEDLQIIKANEQESEEIFNQDKENKVLLRGPASFSDKSTISSKDPSNDDPGTNVFQVLKGLEVSLKSNDKEGIQESLDLLDQALSQIVLGRSEVGARIMTVNGTMDSLQKAIVDTKISNSLLEDADVFQVVSDINKTDSALKATLETSGKMIQPSLLDFLK
ncbi:MAG: flagellar hook-associated protein FlgL [Bdellovibrionaceae bacterium]|nr:flagellar hook-associated protein FlgL [Pseudobdellovibrionaceae bacterium]